MTGPVDLIIATRLREGADEEYTAWQVKLGERLRSQPGFLGQQLVSPSPPAQTDWIVIQKFASLEDAKSWLSSSQLQAAVAEVRHLFVGKDDIYLRGDPAVTVPHVTAMISCRVEPEDEVGFLCWEREMFAATAQAPGFVGQRLERPVPGILDRWVIALTFEDDDKLTAWLESPRRAALLKQGERYPRDVRLRKGTYGFGFWEKGSSKADGSPLGIFKGNLVVLLVLYPIVFVWDYFIGGPYLLSNGVPFWLALFIGNVVSTQLLGWWAIPSGFRWFARWLDPRADRATNIKGYLAIAIGCSLSMALYAALLHF